MRLSRIAAASIASILVLASAVVVRAGLAGHAGHAAVESSAHEASEHPPVFWSVPGFDFPDQRAARVTRTTLLGHVWIADFIFTQCTSACPMLTARMRALQREMADPNLRFVSISVDPVHDTEDALRRYAGLWGSEDTRWSLLRTEPDALQRLTDSMRAIVRPDGDGGVLHTSLFFLVDTRGRVRGLYDSDDDGALRRLRADTEALTHASASPRDAPGRKSLRELGCAGCHDDRAIAPSLAGIWGRDALLADGTSARVDGPYVRESVMSPGTKRVAGYPASMPSYANELSADDLDGLVGEIAALAGAMPQAAHSGADVEAAARTESDPICGMTIRVTASTPNATRDGHTYHFCSDTCRARFLSRPQP